MHSRYLDEMDRQPGAEELKATMHRWNILSENLGRTDPELPILLPDYLLLAPLGSGVSTYLQIMTSYLDDVGLMHFSGDRKYVEFYVEHCKAEAPFETLSRLASVMQAAAGFRDKYCGVLALDCSEWVNDFDSHHMKALLRYLMDHTRDWLIFIVMNCTDKKNIDHIETVISSYLRINVLHLNYPETADMLAYITGQLKGYGFELEADGNALLTESLQQLQKQDHFYGFRTLDLLVQEIIYSIYSGRTQLPKKLTARMLAPFAVDGSYVSNLIDSMKKQKNLIGFL